jgi:hypothetical protein
MKFPCFRKAGVSQTTQTEGVSEQLLRRIFGPKRDEVTGDRRKLHNEKLRNFYSSSNIIRMMKSRRMRWAGHVARMGRRRDAYRRRKRPLGRQRCRWVEHIKIDLRETVCYVMDWIDLA